MGNSIGNSILSKGGGDTDKNPKADADLEEIVPNPTGAGSAKKSASARISGAFLTRKNKNKNGSSTGTNMRRDPVVIERVKQSAAEEVLKAEKLSTFNAAKSAATVAALANEQRKRKIFDPVSSNTGASTSKSGLNLPKNTSSRTNDTHSSEEEEKNPNPQIAIPKIMPNALFSVKLNKVKMPEVSNDAADTPRKVTKLLTCSKTATKIYGHLYVSGDLVARNKDMLLENGITHILNLAKTVCKNYHEGEIGVNGKPLFAYRDFNLIDSTKEGGIYPFILESIKFIEESRKKNGACFVHCHQGVSRSCTMTIAYAMWYEKMKFKDAFNMVKSKHSVCGPNSGFICQLMEWEKRLGLGKARRTDAEFYRIAPHSSRDRSLVIKHCINPEERKPVEATVEVLDPRGAFLLHIPTENRMFIWQGPKCKHPLQYEYSAVMYARLMKKYEPPFENVEILDLHKEEASKAAFFKALNSDESEVHERDIYNEEYDKDKPQGVSDEVENENNEVSDRFRARSRATTAESSYRGSDDDSLIVRLYQWQSETRDWELLTSYDGEDLQSGKLFIVTVHDKKIKSSNKLALSAAYIHRAYIWLGCDLEELISEEGAIAEAKAFLDAKEKCTKNRTEPIETIIMRDMEESDEFWHTFEAGF
eukprot:CAMPEP_0204842758 /NCGR_PEP_ID=MMETSP1346-20131115/47572_1 /ASSEMBLY_ACC=CAM_ASM_000771 /TAXON_ID=215587 /ORGANISM="Aplanochytrium stocchinoi, Strain GSBS06" /LENGTH=647 /DNA_ID=CAMNT_0051981781 /DNA_START=88 /DNA_END=2031 /DNA_ORIENTATION=+